MSLLTLAEDPPVTLTVADAPVALVQQIVQPISLTLDGTQASITAVAAQGPMGPPGPAGPVGPPGTAVDLVFQQQSAAATWVIAHNLARYPSVTTVDSSGDQIIGELLYLDQNNLQVIFTFPTSGSAFLN